MIYLSLAIAVIALVIALKSRSTTRYHNDDIDEIRNSLYELRMTIKSLRAEWNQKIARVHAEALKAEGKIPADRVPYIITKECIACGTCQPECPTHAISEGSIYEIDPGLCIACGKCAKVCPVDACKVMP